MIALRFRASGLAAAALVGLAGCSSTPDLNPGNLVTGGRDVAAEQATAARFAPVAVCPPIQVKDGTQMMQVFEKGKDGDLTAIRFQGTIQRFARECRTDAATGVTSVKVGVSGRFLAGPKGGTGGSALPLRVVVIKDGDNVLYSKLHKVDASIPAGQSGITWSKVIDDIAIPPAQGTNYTIYVGFDEGPAKG